MSYSVFILVSSKLLLVAFLVSALFMMSSLHPPVEAKKMTHTHFLGLVKEEDYNNLLNAYP